MKWKKLGLVYAPDDNSDWMRSHAMLPTSAMLDERRIRIYAAFLDRNKVGRVGYVEVDAAEPRRVLKVSDRPVLDIGDPGTFDDNGVTPTCVVATSSKMLMYYIGWQLGVKVRYFLFVGLAISEDGGEHFRRVQRVPVLDRSDGELFVRSAAHIHYDNGLWKMWYVGGDKWVVSGGKEVPTYNLRYVESSDGIHWPKVGLVCIDLCEKDEFGFGRPFVIKEKGSYRMWYSIRTFSKGYRIGYAESTDGIKWERKDKEVGIDVSAEGWDSQMICFACIQKTKYGTYMFYNGNNCGETGFGVAVLHN